MARTTVPYSNLAGNSDIADPAGTAADPTNGHTIAAAEPERTILRVKNTTGGALNAIVRAGIYPPALASVQGDLTVSVGAGATVWIGPVESGRFIQGDGSLSIDLGAGFTGTVTAFLVPRSV